MLLVGKAEGQTTTSAGETCAAWTLHIIPDEAELDTPQPVVVVEERLQTYLAKLEGVIGIYRDTEGVWVIVRKDCWRKICKALRRYNPYLHEVFTTRL